VRRASGERSGLPRRRRWLGFSAEHHALRALNAILGPGRLIATSSLDDGNAHVVEHQQIILGRLH